MEIKCVQQFGFGKTYYKITDLKESLKTGKFETQCDMHKRLTGPPLTDSSTAEFFKQVIVFSAQFSLNYFI